MPDTNNVMKDPVFNCQLLNQTFKHNISDIKLN